MSLPQRFNCVFLALANIRKKREFTDYSAPKRVSVFQKHLPKQTRREDAEAANILPESLQKKVRLVASNKIS